MLTRSPATMPWLTAPSVTAASPVSTPARAAIVGPRDRTASTRSSAARTARSASSSRATGRAPDGHHRVADELLDGAAVARDDLRREVEVARQQLPDVLRVAVLGERREAHEVREQDRHEASLGLRGLALAGTGEDRGGRPATGVPHSAQNFAPATTGAPHPGQPEGDARPALDAELGAGRVLRPAAACRSPSSLPLSWSMSVLERRPAGVRSSGRGRLPGGVRGRASLDSGRAPSRTVLALSAREC